MTMEKLIPRSAVVYTPDDLAKAMVVAIGDDGRARWLDPCVGDGAFVEQLAALFSVPKERITAFDINSNPSPHKRDLARTQWREDFIKWAGEQGAGMLFDRIILNPPYVALSKLNESLSKMAVALTLPDGSKLSLKANYWCAFLIASLKVLAPGGALCAVLPAAWDYAEYAYAVRKCLRSAFREFVELRSNSPLFDDVQDGSVVIIGRGFGEPLCGMNRIRVADTTEMQSRLLELANGLGAKAIRTLRPVGELPSRRKVLSDIADIRIGAVTGDTRYFVLNDAQRRALSLPTSAFLPVLSRASHLVEAFAGRESWESLRDKNQRIWLFRPSKTSVLSNLAVKRYLLRTEDQMGCRRDRYKVQSRKPWYLTPLPGQVDGFLSGMSKHLPFLVLRKKNKRHLTATNTLYVLRFKNSKLTEAQKAAWALALLSSDARRQMRERARVYADGLLKLEPSDLSSLELPEPPQRCDAVDALMRATRLLLDGKSAEAEEMADAWLGLQKTKILPLGPSAVETLSVESSPGESISS